MSTSLIDTHAHLDFQQYDADREDVIRRATEADVSGIINIGIDLKTSKKAIALAEKYTNIYAAIGIHPHDSADAEKQDFDELFDLAEHPKVVAIGEIGLDFYRNISPAETQRKVFKQLLDLAQEKELPVIVHTRQANEEMMNILRSKSKRGWRGVFHCFSGDATTAAELLDMGFHISFTGNITFKNSRSVEVMKGVPLECLLLETDCPFMAPVPHRGKRNEPAFVRYVAKKIAEVKNVSSSHVGEVTTNNANQLFAIKVSKSRRLQNPF